MILTIDAIDRTNLIEKDSIRKTDNLEESRDTLTFRTLKYQDRGFIPEINQEVELDIDGIKEFGGVIVEVSKKIIAGGIVQYDVICGDYTHYLNRLLVLDRYTDKTVAEIIEEVIDKYADDFTYTNVNCDVSITSVAFNRLTVTACLDKLAKDTNHFWYVDYEKDIHFFPRNENPAPFTVTDTNGNYIQGTLELTDDISQMRNTVYVRGAEERGEERSETYLATADQITFPLANKFADRPEVTVDGSPMTVGVDYLHPEESFDCFWNFNEKYIRFKSDTKPDTDDEVIITGIPLFPIIVRIIAPDSVSEYGYYEFFKEDKTISTRQEAMLYAKSQLESYKDGIIEGQFETNTPGLRSGQLLTIQSDTLDIDETFLIQAVQFKMLSEDKGHYVVKLATMRTIGIIQVLQDLIRFREIREFDPDALLSFIEILDTCGATDSIEAIETFDTQDYYWADVESGQQEGFWNLATWDES
jgi:hypothetical protein